MTRRAQRSGPFGALALACAALPLVGCNPDTAVFVEATIEAATLSVTQSSLVTAVSGAFALRLHLGPRASDASEVDLGAFSLTNDAQDLTIHDPLGVTTHPTFPVTVNVDSDVVITVELAAEDNQMAVDAIDPLCASDGVRIVAALYDSLRGATITATSATVHPSSCP
jgi:hypothetical protein